MKSQISCIWASDFSKNTGEGILGRLFVNKLIINNRKFNKKKIILLNGSKNKKNFYHKYINPFKGVFFLQSHKKKQIIFLNYLPLWNFLVFLLLPKKTILGPITGGIYKGKIKNVSDMIRKYIFPVMYKISLYIIFRKFSNVIFSTSILKKYVSKQDRKKSTFNFIFQNFSTRKSLRREKKNIDVVVYNRNHDTKKNETFDKLILNLYKCKLKILIFGDKFKLKENKHFIYKGYVNRILLLKYLKKSKFSLNSQENFYSLFAIDSYNSQCIVLSDKEIYKHKSLSNNFLSKKFKNMIFYSFAKKKFTNKDKRFIDFVKKNKQMCNTVLGKI